MDHPRHRWDEAGEPYGASEQYARALAAAGLLAPAPLREEWAIGKESNNLIERWGGERIRSLEDAYDMVEARQRAEQVFLRLVSDWLPVDRAESDGRAEP